MGQMSDAWNDLRREAPRTPQRLLNAMQVKDIRLAYNAHIGTQRQLAEWYGVSETTIASALSKSHYTRKPRPYRTHVNLTEHHITAPITHYQYDFTGSDDDLYGWAERVTQRRHRESVARALGGVR